MYKLSILIATVPERQKTFNLISLSLLEQQVPSVQILSDNTLRGEKSIGAKRQRLLNRAGGDYVVFIDDDDVIMPNYIELILKALTTNPDCVDLNILMLTEQQNPQMCYHHLVNKKWHQKGGEYFRGATQFNPVKRSIALKVGFPDLRFGEDQPYSEGITSLCKTSVLIPEIIYLYNFSRKENHNVKYGMVKRH